MKLVNFCMTLDAEHRKELAQEFKDLTGLEVSWHANAFDGFCLGRVTARKVCEDCDGTGFCEGPGEGHASNKVRCLCSV
jgi:hypothetical protein